MLLLKVDDRNKWEKWRWEEAEQDRVRAAQPLLAMHSILGSSRFDLHCQSDWQRRCRVMGIYLTASYCQHMVLICGGIMLAAPVRCTKLHSSVKSREQV